MCVVCDAVVVFGVCVVCVVRAVALLLRVNVCACSVLARVLYVALRMCVC